MRVLDDRVAVARDAVRVGGDGGGVEHWWSPLGAQHCAGRRAASRSWGRGSRSVCGVRAGPSPWSSAQTDLLPGRTSWRGIEVRSIFGRGDSRVPTLDFRPFDADNHYYEALDAFTRHLDPRLGPRTVQWAEIDGRKYHVVGGRVSHAVVNPTFDPIAKPGAMHDYFRGNPEGRSPLEFLRDRERIRPEYRDRDARLGVAGRAGPRGGLALPDARRALRGAAEARPRGGRPSPSAPSTAGSTRTGASPTRTASSPRRTSRSPTSTGPSRSSSGRSAAARASSACGRRRSGRPTARARPADPMLRSVLGAGQRGRHHRRRARRRQRLHERTATPTTASARRSRTTSRPERRSSSTSSAPSTTSSRRSSSSSSSSASRTCASRRSRTAPSSWPTCSGSCARSAQKYAGYFREDPVETFRAARLDQPVLGGRRERGGGAHGRRSA